MSLQIPGASSAQSNAAQMQMLYALGNIQQTTQAAEARVQQVTDETFKHMQQALNHSEENNRMLAERLSQAINRIDQLQKRVEIEESLRRQEKAAFEARINALEIRLKTNEDASRILRTNLDQAKFSYENHSHLDGYTHHTHYTTKPVNCATLF